MRILRDGTVPTPRPQGRQPPPIRLVHRRPPMRLPLASAPRRLHVLLIAITMALSLCAGRLLQLQGFDSSSYKADALTRTLPLLPARGELTDRNGLVLASTQPAVAVTADPTLTTPRAAEFASVLAGHLDMSEAELMPLLTKTGTRFVYLKKKVPALTYSALSTDLANRDLRGIFREGDPIRTYPNGSVGASVVGFVGADGDGLAGLERTLNAQLAGVEGKETFESAPNGSKIPLGRRSITPARNGLSFQLTLDSEVQWAAERRLAEQVAKTRADSGFAIVLDVKTGQVIALANAPSYDSSRPQAARSEDRGNRAISAPYEPGSVQKILTAAALIDSGTASPSTRVVIPGRLASGGRSIKDHFSHGVLRYTMRGVIADSSNIGTALLTRQLDKQRLHDYLVSFGLGSTTTIELPGESSGIIPKPDMPDGQRDRVAFGQAIAVTGIQEAAAIAGVVNGGIYNPPTLIKKAIDGEGHEVALPRAPQRRVISEKSSAEVRDLMQAVIDSENGQRNLKLERYTTGGKTGTAQRADTSCRCYRGYVTSFVGFAPLDDPQILTYVVISNPRNGDTGTVTAVPAYRDIMTVALPRYSVIPDARRHKPLPTEW
ncbi:MAG TPA: penicillin-binding protein 2 [Propionibacteriaceae bacterium]|nr:penicillin-binding protein 2 [Propionibacteriaceae bacterium]